ncbi:unnamed protein product [Cuscuta europaea]|uniref:RNase H type-1 domain-containing protein n=1 Tax=Cuscuta europaea TaxID=41803 RepID=A0A9P0ZFX5_CUSEU|nr:unnamed protein product [Cuscuta europaea]
MAWQRPPLENGQQVCHMCSGLPKDELCIFVITCWSLWKAQNEKTWRNSSSNWSGVIACGDAVKAGWRNAQETATKTCNWIDRQPEEMGEVEIDVDAALQANGDGRSIGMVARGDSGEFLKAKSIALQDRFSPSTMEAMAVEEAVRWVVDSGIQDVKS